MLKARKKVQDAEGEYAKYLIDKHPELKLRIAGYEQLLKSKESIEKGLIEDFFPGHLGVFQLRPR